MKREAGFTLIELLVAVLIIGILAAVALPMYQRAVLKSKYQKFIVYGKTLVESAERFYIANGAYPASWDDLDIEIPDIAPCSGTDKKCDRKGNGFIVDLEDGGRNFAFYFLPKQNIYYVIWFKNNPANRGRECGAAPDDETANNFCKNLGGIQNGTMGIMSNPSHIRYDLP